MVSPPMSATSQAVSASSPPRPLPARPELLAPAGDWECVHAAVENGADAVYFGLERFNARMRAKNFTLADLPALMEFLHRRGVRGYVTFNILVFTPELPDAETFLRAIIAAGVDAAIVQDIGVCRLIRRLSPDFPIHGSTQMSVTNAAGVAFARELGAELVVLARENSIKEIEAIQESQKADPLPLEVFVHGALCVAYSGQCLTSESLGGRSANRGECAQACRLPYELVSDGAKVDLGDRSYLLSPQDLAGLDVLPELVRSGVASLKIEGRLKSPEYVASITRVYRQALDKIFTATDTAFDPARARYELAMTFSRGLYTGWFRGIQNQELAHGRFGTKRGVLLGKITRVGDDHVAVHLESALKPGDGVVFDAGNHAAGEEGGRVYQVEPQPTRDGRPAETVLRFGQGDINFRRIRPGNLLWKNNDPALDRELRATFEGEKIRFTRPIAVEVHGRAGTPLTLILDDGEGHVVRMDSQIPLAAAQNQPLTPERLREQLGRLGGTPFRLDTLASHLEGAAMLPMSELNRLRRDAAAELDRLRMQPKRWTLTDYRIAENPLPKTTVPPTEPELVLVVRSLEQLDAVLGTNAVRTVYCEFENPKHYRDAVERFRVWQAGAAAGTSIWVAPPRIFKPGEEWILKQVRSSEADGYLVRNHEHLRFFKDDRKRGDFSLNVANPLTAEYFIEHYNLERITASYDLNVVQLEALLQGAPAAWFDLTIHQHMPMFHMEHCVFCAFLSSGKDYHDCGRPCEKHRVALRDRVGAELPLKADAGCRNTVYNNRAQTGAEYLQRFLALGARSFRVEFVNESADEVVRTVARYRQLLSGEISGADLWRELKLINQLGVTRGQMETAPQAITRKR
ncbi:MAG: U32 family peptidase [Verrucomicrobia bacterium]|nr:U32 family peptidase [Verrucomicrobiota bacterium]